MTEHATALPLGPSLHVAGRMEIKPYLGLSPATDLHIDIAGSSRVQAVAVMARKSAGRRCLLPPGHCNGGGPQTRRHQAGCASAPWRCSGFGRAWPFSVKPSETEFRQWRSPVGGGPSGNTWPRWLSQRAQTISVRIMP
ncbi:hypothetical protein ABZP12_00564 [Xanthomonas euvesicatoria]